MLTATSNGFLWFKKRKKRPPPAPEQTSAEAAWDQWTAALRTLVSSAVFTTHTQVHPTGFGIYLDLADPDPIKRNQQLFNIADAVPGDSFFTTGAVNSLSGNYKLFLGELKSSQINHFNLTELERLRIKKLDLSRQEELEMLEKLRANSLKMYENSGSTDSINVWMNENLPEYRIRTQRIENLSDNINSMASKAHQPGYESILDAAKRFESAKQPYEETPDNMPVQKRVTVNGKIMRTFSPLYTLNGFDNVYSEWESGESEKKFTVKISESRASSTTKSVNGGGSIGFFNFNLNLGASKTETSTANSKYNLTITLNAAAFEVRPGDWFKQGLVQRYQDTVSNVYPPFFGQNGTFSRIITHVIIGYLPVVSIELERSMYTSIKKGVEAGVSGTVMAGPVPINLGASAKHSSDKETFNDSRGTIDFESNINQPILLGVVSEPLSRQN